MKVSIKKVRQGIAAAFPYTVPILFGWIFVALTYGVLMNELGYNAWWTMLFSAVCYCGGMQIAAIPIIAAGFDPLQMFLVSYLVNFRHTFYGVPLLEKFRETKPFKPFLVYWLCDEEFSLCVSEKTPDGMENRYFFFGIGILCYLYWICLSGLGTVIGSLISFDTTGIDFALNALFVVLFLQQWKEKQNRLACIIGIAVTLISRIIFGSSIFLIPALLGMLLIFWLGRNKI